MTRPVIAEYCCISISCLDNWRKRHGFPTATLPDGRIVTTKMLIDQWIMARARVASLGKPKLGRPSIVGETARAAGFTAVDNLCIDPSHPVSD